MHREIRFIAEARQLATILWQATTTTKKLATTMKKTTSGSKKE